MLVLVSPVSLEEAHVAARGGADIIDVKNTEEGSLGANFPWVIKQIADALQGRRLTVSATLGDLPFKPGTAALAASGASHAGARYIKAGLYDIPGVDEGVAMMRAVARACRDHNAETIIVTAGYADFKRFGGLSPDDLVAIAEASASDVVMLDTAIKDATRLFDHLSADDLQCFTSAAQKRGLKVALAGSIRRDDLDALFALGCDITGVRGAVCGGSDRTTTIEEELVRSFMAAVRERRLAAASAAE